MSYLTKTEEVRIGARSYQICSLLDSNQAPLLIANSNENSCIGINQTNWPFFGKLWAAGKLLAEIIDEMNLEGMRILEVGCGLAMAGIVAHSKKLDIVVSDYHPQAAEFLARNLTLNGLPPMPYVEANWSKIYADLGTFDLIIGSDVLYDREYPPMLAAFLMRHLKPRCQVLIIDPGRQNFRQFSKEMLAKGFTCVSTRKKLAAEKDGAQKFHVLDYRRAG